MDVSTLSVLGGLAVIGVAWVTAGVRGQQAVAAAATRLAVALLQVLAWVATMGRHGVSPWVVLTRSEEQSIASRLLVTLDVTRQSNSVLPEYDFAVVGGGAAGLAAVTELRRLRPQSTIVLIEAGPAVAGGGGAEMRGLPAEMSALRLPCYSLHAAHSKFGAAQVVDLHARAAEPTEPQWNFATKRGTLGCQLDGSTAFRDAAFGRLSSEQWATLGLDDESRALAMQAQARLLGTSLTAEKHNDLDREHASGVIPTAPVLYRCPLSWALATAATDEENEEGTVVASSARTGSVRVRTLDARWNAARGMAKDRLSDSLLEYASSNPRPESGAVRGVIHVLCDSKVDSVMQESNDRRVRVGIAGELERHVVARVVVLAVGVHRSPSLLELPRPTSNDQRSFADAKQVSLLYQARPGVSLDSCNTQTLFALLRQAALRPAVQYQLAADIRLMQRALVDLDEEAARAKRVATTSVTAPPALGLTGIAPFDSFLDVTLDTTGTRFHVELVPAAGFNRELFAAQGWSPELGVFKEAFALRLTLPPTATSAAAREALRWCRRMATTGQPLCFLSTGREALDLKACAAKGPVPASAFKLLYGKPPKVRRGSREALESHAGEVFRRVRELAESDEYLDAYFAKHALFVGAVPDGRPIWVAPSACVAGEAVGNGAIFNATRARFLATVPADHATAAVGEMAAPGQRLPIDLVAGTLAARDAVAALAATR
jgi:hypothetical protein